METPKQNASDAKFLFNEENFQDPKLPLGLNVIEVNSEEATDDSLKGYGFIVRNPNDFTTASNNFEIRQWPAVGSRQLDPNTGDEAGTTEGNFSVRWEGDYYYGENLAVSTTNNKYLDGLGAPPETASHSDATAVGDGNHIYLWMSDYHPDGGQLFWPLHPIPFTVCLGLSSHGDSIAPHQMRAFSVPAGSGVYIHPGTWHNGVYVSKELAPTTFLTRQGKVHARVSCSWATEFNSLIKVNLKGGHDLTSSSVPLRQSHYRKTIERVMQRYDYPASTCCDTVFMVRPSNFRMNEQTAFDNHFQKAVGEELTAVDIAHDTQQEFDHFVKVLREHNIHVITVSDDPQHDTPDAVFPNNWISFHASGELVVYPMYAANRRLERRADITDLMIEHGFNVQRKVDYSHHESKGAFLEGTGSMVLDRVHKIAYCALSCRATESLLETWCRDMGYTPVCFTATDMRPTGEVIEIYHTNVMMAIATTFVVICLEAIRDPQERQKVYESLQNSGKQIVPISLEQVHKFAGNMLQLRSRPTHDLAASPAGRAPIHDGDENVQYHMVMSSTAYESLTSVQIQIIQDVHGCNIIRVPLHILETCGGGSARCMLAEVFLQPQSAAANLL